MTTFAGRAEALAIAMGLPSPVEELYLSIERLVFCFGGPQHSLCVESSPDNMKSRLFVEALARQHFLTGETSYLDLEKLRPVIREFFGEELCNDAPGTGKHPIIDGLLGYQQVQITWKAHEAPDAKLDFERLLYLARMR